MGAAYGPSYYNMASPANESTAPQTPAQAAAPGGVGIHNTETNVAMRMTLLTQRTEDRTLFRRVSKRKALLLQASIPGNERSPHQRIRLLDGMQDGRSGLHALGVIPR